MIKEIKLNNGVISYDLQRKNVKNINLRIKPDGSVYLSANRRVPQAVIDEFLQSKADLISNALKKFEELSKHLPKQKQYIDGETFYILGQKYRLQVVLGRENKVDKADDRLYLHVRFPNDTALKKKTLDAWRRSMCIDVITSLCADIYPEFQKHGVAFPKIKFRKMVSRWGSCQPAKGILTFNTALITAPLTSIEYVVAHEFTHFLQPNHSDKFYHQLALFIPDWQQRKEKLKKSELEMRINYD